MRRRRLWCVVLISGLGALLFTAAKPANERVRNASRWEHVNRTCRARECNETVNYEQLRSIESNMNASADPCQSFFNYSCGNWRNANPHSKTMMKKGGDQLIARYVLFFEDWLFQRELAEQEGVFELNARRSLAVRNELPERKQLAEIREIMNDDMEKESRLEGKSSQMNKLKDKESYGSEDINSNWRPLDDPILQKLLKYYRICKAQNNRQQHNLRAYYEITKSSVNWQLVGYDWLKTLAGVNRFGYSEHFLNMRVVQKNVSVHSILIAPHELDSQLKINSEIYEVLHDFTDLTLDALQQRLEALENDLEKIKCQYCEYAAEEGDDIEECDCYRYDLMTFANLTAQFSEVDWRLYSSMRLGRQLESNDVVVVINIGQIRLQLAYVQQIDPELSLVYTLARFLNYIRDERLHFVEHDTIELSCIHHMRKVMNLPMNYLYERAYFSSRRPDSQRIIEQVFEELKVQFERMIDQNNMQFSSSIRQKLRRKLKHVNINVGNLPKNVSMQFYYDYIEAFNFGEDFVYNHLHALEVFYKHYNSLVNATEDETRHLWSSFSLLPTSFDDNLDMSPYYNVRTNLIVITYAYLQLPFYDSSFWPVFIYGDLASTLGHELIHAFDTHFLKFDENGDMNTQPLTSMLLNQNFRKNFICLQRDTLFETERMADVSGARLALNTFLSLDPNALEHNGELYFLQFSQFFCSVTNHGDHTHDSENLRLDYVVGVLPEFSRVFNCPLGSPMNPYEKCEMYT